jgi:xanthine/uracil permease
MKNSQLIIGILIGLVLGACVNLYSISQVSDGAIVRINNITGTAWIYDRNTGAWVTIKENK